MDLGETITLENGGTGTIKKRLDDGWFEILLQEGEIIKVQLEKIGQAEAGDNACDVPDERQVDGEDSILDAEESEGALRAKVGENEENNGGKLGERTEKKKTSPGSDNPEDKIPPKRLISILRDQITKRNLIINAIREAYETDVITLRNQLYRWRENKPEHLLDQRVLLDSIPSLNFGGCIKFFEPEGYQLRFRKCPRCSGSVELIVAELHRGKREPTPEELALMEEVENLKTELDNFKNGAKFLKDTHSKELREMNIKMIEMKMERDRAFETVEKLKLAPGYDRLQNKCNRLEQQYVLMERRLKEKISIAEQKTNKANGQLATTEDALQQSQNAVNAERMEKMKYKNQVDNLTQQLQVSRNETKET